MGTSWFIAKIIFLPILFALFAALVLSALAICTDYMSGDTKRSWYVMMAPVVVGCGSLAVVFVKTHNYGYAAFVIFLLLLGVLAEAFSPEKYRTIPCRVRNLGRVESYTISPAGGGYYSLPSYPSLDLKIGEKIYSVGGYDYDVHLAHDGADLLEVTWRHKFWPSQTMSQCVLVSHESITNFDDPEQAWRLIPDNASFHGGFDESDPSGKPPRFIPEVWGGLAILLIGAAIFWGMMRDDKAERAQAVSAALTSATKASSGASEIHKSAAADPLAKAAAPKGVVLKRPGDNKLYRHGVGLYRVMDNPPQVTAYRYGEEFACLQTFVYVSSRYSENYRTTGKYCWPLQSAPGGLIKASASPSVTGDDAFKPKASLLIETDNEGNKSVHGAVMDFEGLDITCLFDDASSPVGCWATESEPAFVIKYRDAGVVVAPVKSRF